MKLAAAALKSLVKKLAADSTLTLLDTKAGSLTVFDDFLTILVTSPLLKYEEELTETFVAVNSRQLASVVNRTAGEVELSLSPNDLTVKCAKARWELATVTAKAPKLPKSDASVQVSLPVLKSLLGFAASASDPKNKYDYCGSVWLRPITGQLIAAGTDMQRLMVAEGETKTDGLPELLIPSGAVKALSSLDGETVWVGHSESALFFGTSKEGTTVTIVARKLTKKFPDYRSVLAPQYKFVAKLKAVVMRDALRSVTPADDARAVILDFKPEVLRLYVGEAKDEFKAEDEIGYELIAPDLLLEDFTPFKIKLKHEHLSDFFNAVEGEVRFHGNAEFDPVWLEAGNRKMLMVGSR